MTARRASPAGAPDAADRPPAPPDRPQVGELEAWCWARGWWPVLGADEVGRGPLAGPVVAAAVVLGDDAARDGAGLAGLDDSKRLTEAEREALVPRILAVALAWAVVPAEIDVIAARNILGASLWAMAEAGTAACARLGGAATAPAVWLIDGNQRLPGIGARQITAVKGDGRSRAIAAASVVAKVWRDRRMVELDRAYPGYGLARHKGYPTAEHLAALARLGPTPIHRASFGPVAAATRQRGLFD